MLKSDQLFVCYGGVKKAASVSKQRMSNWILERITLAYKAAGNHCPGVRSSLKGFFFFSDGWHPS